MAMIRACLTMLPRLEARENLTASRQVGVGTGSYEKATLQDIDRDWRATAFPRPRRRMKRVQVDE